MGPLLLLALVLFLLLLVLRRRRRPRERPGPVKEAARRGGGGRRALPHGEENLRPALQAAAHRGLGGRQDLRPLPLLRRCLQHHLHLHHWSVLFRPGGLRTPGFPPSYPPAPFLCYPRGPSVFPPAPLLCHPVGIPCIISSPPGTPCVTHQEPPVTPPPPPGTPIPVSVSPLGTACVTPEPHSCIPPRDTLCPSRTFLCHPSQPRSCVTPQGPAVSPRVPPSPSCPLALDAEPRQSRPGAARRRLAPAAGQGGFGSSLPAAPSALGDPERPSLSPPRGLRWQRVPHALRQPPEPTWPLPSALIPVPAGSRAVGSPFPCLHRY